MTDDERFYEAVIDVAYVPPTLRLADWDALPLTARVADKLAEALVLTQELRMELASGEAAAIAWIAPRVDEVFKRLGTILGRLSS